MGMYSMKIKSVSKRVIASGVVALLMASPSFASGSKPENGTYIGAGDGVITLVRIQGSKITLGSLGVNSEPSEKSINKALSTNGFTGKLTALAHGKLMITLGDKEKSEPMCQIPAVLKPSGSIRLLDENGAGCGYYHGGSWDFVPADQDSKSGDLKPIKKG